MRLLLAAVVVLMLSSMAFAATETRQLGPYAVSLNMNTNMNYQVQVQDPVQTPFFTLYRMVIATDNTTGAAVSISEYKNLTDSTIATDKDLAGFSMALRGINVTAINDRTIDGKKGFVVVGTPVAGLNMPSGLNFYQASYWLDSKDCECGPVSVGKVNVGITSTYPQAVTEGILSSVHVAGSQAQSTQMGQQMPPSEMPPAQMTQQMPTQQTPKY